MELLEVTMQLQHNDGRLNESSKVRQLTCRHADRLLNLI